MPEVPFAQVQIKIGKKYSSGDPMILTRRTIAILEDAGRDVGKDLVDGVVQGSFHPGNKNSGGTHDKGGVFDLSGSQGLATAAVEEALRNRGVAAWIRPKRLNPDGTLKWGLHLHGVDAFDPDLSEDAEVQVDMYRDNLNGLPGARGPDTDRPHPILKRFPDPEEDDVQLTDMVRLKKWQERFYQGKEISVGSLLADAAAQSRRNKRQLDALATNVADLASLIAKPMSEEDRRRLAEEVAQQVVQMREDLSDADDDAEDTPDDTDPS
ncbi:MAG: hypothetical protein L0Y54_00375 [Sporichthyaceae bacterium]|nr:hypothetical protein [Sporichthyaceae bacterium]